MLFQNVSIAGLAHVDAPHTLTSKEINGRLQPTYDRLGIKTDVLGDVAGIHARRLWDQDVQASDAATQAARKALIDAGIGIEKIGLLVNTSVSRDYLEPSTASIVSGNLGVGDHCVTFDVANACLASSTAWTSPRACSSAVRSTTHWSWMAKPPIWCTKRLLSA